MRLIAENLDGERGGETIFSDVDFSLSDGQSLVVTGPNGAGKSTLLRVIAGLLPVASGSVRLDGGGDTWPSAGAGSHYLGHRNAMKTALTVEENLRFWQTFSGDARVSVDDALEKVELGDIGHLPYGYLSAGQRRRAAIARLLINFRPLWLLDEPTAGLDKASETRFTGLMKTHLDSGGIIVAATHQPLGLEGAGELRLGVPAGA
jgi:heme exporter protein A